ncbi:MAG: hypothetical protein [Bacteriophage sp.]|nr:MAG: hypothetical protein [Bacteriophage sp.]
MIKVKTTDECVQTTLKGDSHSLLDELSAATATLMQILIEDCDATPGEAEREIKKSCMAGICFTEHRLKQKTK